jgi:hypothetical protein
MESLTGYEKSKDQGNDKTQEDRNNAISKPLNDFCFARGFFCFHLLFFLIFSSIVGSCSYIVDSNDESSYNEVHHQHHVGYKLKILINFPLLLSGKDSSKLGSPGYSLNS